MLPPRQRIWRLALTLSAGVFQAAGVEFSQSARTVQIYDFVEVTMRVSRLSIDNPFTDVMVTGQFAREGEAPLRVDGFCNSDDASLFNVRFMPSKPGRYRYSVEIRGPGLEAVKSG